MILTFALVALLLTLTPGADTALVLRSSIASGRRAGVVCTLGICTGTMTWAAASSLGISALVAASRVAFDVLRFGGAAYLVWLGISAFRSHGQAVVRPPGRAYRDGLVTNLLNPKIGVFYATLLPQFTSSFWTALLLAGIHAAMGLVWLAGVATVADRAAATLSSEAWRRRLERVTGVVLLGFGVRVLAS